MQYLWIILSLISAIFMGTKDIIAKKFFVKEHIASFDIVFLQYFVGIILTLFFFSDINFLAIFNHFYLFLFKAFAVGIFSLVYFAMLRKFEISKVTPLTNLTPLLLIVFSAIFLNQILTFIQIIGIFLIILSTYFIEFTSHKTKKNLKTHLFEFGDSGFNFFFLTVLLLISLSFAAISDRLILTRGISVFTDLFFTAFFVLIFLFLYAIKFKLLNEIFSVVKINPKILFISFFSFISAFFILMAISLSSTVLVLAVSLKRTSTLISVFLGGEMFSEENLKIKLISAIIMIIGIFLII